MASLPAPPLGSSSSPFASPLTAVLCIFLSLLLLLPRPVLSQCKNVPVIFNFGDSNSDTGGLVAGLGFPVNPPNGRSFFGSSTGRLSDGRLVIDFLCQSVNASFLSPYMESLGSTFRNGANFAVVGSSTLPKFKPFALNVQVMQFLRFKARSLQLAAAVYFEMKFSQLSSTLHFQVATPNSINPAAAPAAAPISGSGSGRGTHLRSAISRTKSPVREYRPVLSGLTGTDRYCPELRTGRNHRARLPVFFKSGFGNMIGDEEFRNALYMIDIGQNDLADSFSKNLSYVQVIKRIPSVTMEIKNAVKAMYDQGGRKFWVHNTGPLGCLPQKLSMVRRSPNDLDPVGCLSSYNAATRVFNEALRRLCVEMSSEMKDATIVHVDIYSIKYDLIANSTKYGFSSPLMACCGYGGPPYNYNIRVPCGQTGSQACIKGSEFVSWDGIHYTEAANTIIASKICSMAYSTPHTPFNFFCRG